MAHFRFHKFRVLAQADPLGAMMGGPALPPPPGGGMPTPGAPGAPEAPQVIAEPIATIKQLVEDAGVADTIKNKPQLDTDAIALQVWEDYGGLPDGRVDRTKVGLRTDADAQKPPEEVAKTKELQDKQHRQYERLPKGDTLLDLKITLDDLTKAVNAMPFSIVQKVKGQAGGGAAGGTPGGMPPMMGANRHWFRKTAKFKPL